MADEKPKTEETEDAKPAPVPLRGVRDRWQVPTLVLAITMLGATLFTVSRRAPGPDFDGVLDEAARLIENQQVDDSLSLLNGPIRENIEHEHVTPRIRAEFHALRADCLYLLAKARKSDIDDDHRAVLAEYERAKQHDASVLDSHRRTRQVSSLVSLNRLEEAEQMIESIPNELADQRHDLLTELIDSYLEQGSADGRERALRFLAILKSDPLVSEGKRLWAVGRQADVRIANGDAEAAANELLPAIQRLTDRTSPEAGGLLARLGRAHLEMGELIEARKRLEMAIAALPEGSLEAGEAETLIGQIDMMEGNIEAARDRFALATERYRLSPVLVRASLGLGEAEAELGHFDISVESYGKLIELLEDPDELLLQGRDIRALRREVERSLEQRYRDRYLNDDLEFALQYASLSERLFPADDLPDEALRRLADTYRRIAETVLAGSAGLTAEESADVETIDIDDIEPAAAEEARVNFYLAGEYYSRHTRATITHDSQTAADSLWLAADSFDRAGELQLAIRYFGEYAASRTGDARQLEARYRLAQAHQALGSYANAIGIYEEIIEDNPTSAEAYRSHVPLARCYMLIDEGTELTRAEDHLLSVLDGTYFAPESPQFREALMELGQTYRKVGRYADAIERLREAIERYPDAPELDRLRFDLADALRLSASEIEEELNLAMPQSKRIELTKLREDRLNEALTLYDAVRDAIDAKQPLRRTPLEGIILRNALFYRGDCAFELADYGSAIEFYDAAAQRYADEPASLVAMVQIVNCYAAMNEWRQAATAHTRAKARLAEFPEDVWQRDDVPMRREHWERWLDASIQLEEPAVAAFDDR
ncbi:MAG: tetratricopeptide repeat protein [Phycisphaerales bacterium]